MKNKNLEEMLVEASVLRGDFTLSSGKKSNYYIDKYSFETRPDLLGPVTDGLKELILKHTPNVELLAVPALGAVPLGAALSLKMNLPYVIVRKSEKEYGTESKLEGAHSKGDNTVVVEDIVTTGGESVRSIKSLLEEDLNVKGVFCVVNREQGGETAIGEFDVPLYSLFTSTGLGLTENETAEKR